MFNPGDLVRLKPEYWTWYRENISKHGSVFRYGDTLYVRYLVEDPPVDGEYVSVEEIDSMPTSANVRVEFLEKVE